MENSPGQYWRVTGSRFECRSPHACRTPGSSCHGWRGKLPPPRFEPKLPGYVSPFHAGRLAGLNGSVAKFGPCATCCVLRVCSAQRPPILTLVRLPWVKVHSPSALAYFSLSFVLAGLAPKIQSSLVPVKTDGLPFGKSMSTGCERP